jgi:hypothetical protein
MAEEILTQIGIGVGVGTGISILSDYLKAGVTYGKWKAIGANLSKPLIADVLQKLLGAEKDPVHGLSSTGMVDTIFTFIDKTMDFSWLINEQIASQLFVQMIQQSIAYAIHSSHAGSIGTICNVYAGSQSMGSMMVSSIDANADLIDRATKAFLTASAGMNIPTTAFEVAKGANTRIEDVYRKIISQVDGLVDDWNDQTLSYHRHYITMARNCFQSALEMKEQIVTKAYTLLEQVGNEHLARISEQMDTLDGAKEWFTAGYASEDELKQIALRVNVEREASETNYDDFKAEIVDNVEQLTPDWDQKIEVALADIQASQSSYALLLKTIFTEIFNDVNEFVNAICNEANKQVEDVCAYRNIEQAVKVVEATSLGEYESSPEVEVFSLRYQKWTVVESITRKFEGYSVKAVGWELDLSHDMGIVSPEIAKALARRKWEKQETTVVYAYVSVPLTAWSKAT